MITNITVENRKHKLKEPFVTAIRRVESIETLVVTIETDEGFEGIGAASPTLKITGDSLKSITSCILGPIKEAIIGKPVRSLELLTTSVKNCCVGNRSAKAAVDIAIYDLLAKKSGQPLYEFLGGYQNEITTDMTLSIGEESAMAKKSASLIRKGFKTLKVKLGGKYEEDISRMKLLRKTVGDDITLRIDANQNWDPKTAVRFIKQLEKENIDIELIEQPVKAWDFEGLAYVTNHVDTPIMADESLFTVQDAIRLIKLQACDLFNIKFMKSGGIREAIAIADIAEAAGIPCMIGSMMESPVSVSAAVHLGCAHRNIILADMDAPLWLENLDKQLEPLNIQYDGPNITCLEKAGLGEVN